MAPNTSLGARGEVWRPMRATYLDDQRRPEADGFCYSARGRLSDLSLRHMPEDECGAGVHRDLADFCRRCGASRKSYATPSHLRAPA